MVGVMVLGDSNIKHIFVKEVFEAKLKNKVSFTQTNTKDALEITIEKAPKKGKKLLFHCSWMNKINARSKGMEDKNEERVWVMVIRLLLTVSCHLIIWRDLSILYFPSKSPKVGPVRRLTTQKH